MRAHSAKDHNGPRWHELARSHKALTHRSADCRQTAGAQRGLAPIRFFFENESGGRACDATHTHAAPLHFAIARSFRAETPQLPSASELMRARADANGGLAVFRKPRNVRSAHVPFAQKASMNAQAPAEVLAGPTVASAEPEDFPQVFHHCGAFDRLTEASCLQFGDGIAIQFHRSPRQKLN